MNAVVAIVTAVVNHMRRDRSSLVFLVLLPVGLMYLMGNIYEAEDQSVTRVGLVVERTDSEVDAVAELVRSSESIEAVPFAHRAALDDAVRRRRVDAGVVLDAGHVAEVVGAPDVALPGGVVFVVRGAQSRIDQAVVLAATVPTLDLDGALALLPAAAEAPIAAGVEARTEAAIGVLVLVAFMNLIAFGSIVPSHRQLGVIDRVGAAPVRRSAVLAGYAVAFVAVALIQVTTMLLAGRVGVGISWGPTVQVAAVAFGLAVAAGGAGTMAAAVLPSPEAGSSVGGPVGFALGMLGGCLWPLSFVGGTLETIGRWVPHNWAVETLRDVAAGVAGAGQVVASAAALVGVGLFLALIGSRRFAATWA